MVTYNYIWFPGCILGFKNLGRYKHTVLTSDHKLIVFSPLFAHTLDWVIRRESIHLIKTGWSEIMVGTVAKKITVTLRLATITSRIVGSRSSIHILVSVATGGWALIIRMWTTTSFTTVVNYVDLIFDLMRRFFFSKQLNLFSDSGDSTHNLIISLAIGAGNLGFGSISPHFCFVFNDCKSFLSVSSQQVSTRSRIERILISMT